MSDERDEGSSKPAESPSELDQTPEENEGEQIQAEFHRRAVEQLALSYLENGALARAHAKFTELGIAPPRELVIKGVQRGWRHVPLIAVALLKECDAREELASLAEEAASSEAPKAAVMALMALDDIDGVERLATRWLNEGYWIDARDAFHNIGKPMPLELTLAVLSRYAVDGDLESTVSEFRSCGVPIPDALLAAKIRKTFAVKSEYAHTDVLLELFDAKHPLLTPEYARRLAKALVYWKRIEDGIRVYETLGDRAASIAVAVGMLDGDQGERGIDLLIEFGAQDELLRFVQKKIKEERHDDVRALLVRIGAQDKLRPYGLRFAAAAAGTERGTPEAIALEAEAYRYLIAAEQVALMVPSAEG